MFNFLAFLAWLLVLVSMVLAILFAPFIFSTLVGVLVFCLFISITVGVAIVINTDF